MILNGILTAWKIGKVMDSLEKRGFERIFNLEIHKLLTNPVSCLVAPESLAAVKGCFAR